MSTGVEKRPSVCAMGAKTLSCWWLPSFDFRRKSVNYKSLTEKRGVHPMKKIVLACGSGIATSTAVASKVTALLNEHGYEGQFMIVQCAISEALAACDDADVLVATTVAPNGLTCPYVSGVPFLTGVGRAAAEEALLAALAD